MRNGSCGSSVLVLECVICRPELVHFCLACLKDAGITASVRMASDTREA